MKALIYAAGDPSVGINSGRIMVDFGNCGAIVEDDREAVRKTLADAFGQLLDEPVSVHFADDPPDPFAG